MSADLLVIPAWMFQVGGVDDASHAFCYVIGMSDNVEDAVPQILRVIQRDLSELRSEMRTRFNLVDETLRKQRRDTAGLLVMAKSLSGNFAEGTRRYRGARGRVGNA